MDDQNLLERDAIYIRSWLFRLATDLEHSRTECANILEALEDWYAPGDTILTDGGSVGDASALGEDEV